MNVFDSDMICYNVNVHSDGSSFPMSCKRASMFRFMHVYTPDRRACYYMKYQQGPPIYPATANGTVLARVIGDGRVFYGVFGFPRRRAPRLGDDIAPASLARFGGV